MSAILYDFKRSFFRLSTIILLLVFILVGISSTYLIYSNMVQRGYSIEQKLSIIATTNIKDQELVVEGYIFNEEGKPVESAQIELYVNNKLMGKTSSEANGFFTLNTGVKISTTSIEKFLETIGNLTTSSKLVVRFENIKEEVKAQMIKLPIVKEIPIPTIIPRIYYLKRTLYTYQPPMAFEISSAPVLITKLDKDNTATIVFVNPFLSPVMESIHVSYCIGDYISMALELTKNATEACKEINDLGYFNGSIIFVKIPLDPDKNGLLLFIEKDHVNTTYLVQYSFKKGIESVYLSLLSMPLGLIVNFAPIIMLYLAYVLMAKPRSIGALEFILARPITRLDLYLTRYFAAILTAFTLSVAVVIGLGLSTTVIIGIMPDFYVLLTIALSLFIGLTTIYTLYYAIATSIRSGLYLAISIILYLVFTIFWQTIIVVYALFTGQLFDFHRITELINYSYYFNPIGSINLILAMIQKSYGLTSVEVNPYYLILSIIIWITIPLILGYLRFRKINLSA